MTSETWIEGAPDLGDLPETPPRIADRYRVLGVLGSGGMGTVYRVHDEALDEVVALKMLRPEVIDTPGAIARFRQEVKLARRVSHPNVVRTFDLGEHVDENGRRTQFLTMAHIEGRSLRRHLTELGPLGVTRTRRLGAQIARGMAAAHEAGVLHRDLKPDNVLLDDDAKIAMITDFGIASLRGDAVVHAGTPGYMSPEQARGEGTTPRSDVHALGAVLYEMITGHKIVHGSINRLSLGIREVVARCIDPEPGRRFATGTDVAAALEALGDHAETTPMPRAAPPMAGRRMVALVPFRNLGSPEDDVVLTGLSEEILDALARSPQLRVCPVTSGGVPPAAEVAIEGSARRAEGKLRVSVRMVADGLTLWSRRLDLAPETLLRDSERMAVQIAEALTVTLDARARGQSTDPAAVDLYLRGRHALRTGWNTALIGAIELFSQAVERAPDDPVIVSAWAAALARGAFFGGPNAEARVAAASAAVARALRLGPDMADPYVALASLRLNSGDGAGAAAAVREALVRQPGMLRAQEMCAALLAESGRLPEAATRLEMILDLDPHALIARWELVRVYALMGRWTAIPPLMAVKLDEDAARAGRMLVAARLAVWRDDEALPDPPAFEGSIQPTTQAVLAFVEMVRGLRSGVRPDPSEFERIHPRGSVRLEAVARQMGAEVYCSIGWHDLAFEQIDKTIAAGLFDVSWMDACPVLAPLRADPRWTGRRDAVARRADAVRAALEGRE